MSDKPSLQELLEVQAYFALPSPALVEAEFHRDMVYGDQIDYAACIGTLKELTEQLHKGDL